MRKRLSSGQKWFLRPNFPLTRGRFVFRSGPRFSFLALEVPEPRVRKRSFSLTKKDFGNLFFGFRIFCAEFYQPVDENGQKKLTDFLTPSVKFWGLEGIKLKISR